MGYNTEFFGKFEFDAPLTKEQANYINKFSRTRRMKRNEEETKDLPDPTREAVGLEVGKDGEYFVGGHAFRGQGIDVSVLDANRPPGEQPDLWCRWIVYDNKFLAWDGSEKFYGYVEWLQYLIDHFFRPWGRTLNGETKWYGEDPEDLGKITIRDNTIQVQKGRIVYE